jgi:hypothetical protein
MTEERCSLEQELISTKKNPAVWRKNSTIRQKNPLLLGTGTHLNAEELCSLVEKPNNTQQKSSLKS